MVKAIVYESHTGFTRMYAKILGWELGMEDRVYSLKEAERKVCRGSEIIFLGWVCGGKVMGYEAAARPWRIRAVCAVGLNFPSEQRVRKVMAETRIQGCPVFYLQGGYRHDQQGLVYRTMMKVRVSALMAKEHKTEEDYKILHMIREGANLVNEDSLAPVREYLCNLYGGDGHPGQDAEKDTEKPEEQP